MKMRYLLYYNQEQIEDSVIIPNPYVKPEEIEEYDSVDNWSGQAKKVRNGLYFTGKDALKNLKYHLRVANREEYAWNGKNMFTPKKEVTHWIGKLSAKTIYEQEINRLSLINDDLQQSVDEYEYCNNRMKKFIPNFGKIRGVIDRLRRRNRKVNFQNEQEVENHKAYIKANDAEVESLLIKGE